MHDPSEPTLLHALRESERRFRLLTENVQDVIWTWDLRANRFGYISPSIARLRGISVEEALAEPLEATMTPESFEEVTTALAEALAGTRPDRNSGIVDQPRKDGTIRHVEITSTIIRDAAGVPVEVVGVSRDATERVEAEAALRVSESRLRMIARSFPNGSVALFDADDRLVFLDGSKLFLVADAGDALGNVPEEFAPPDLAIRIREALRRARSGEIVHAESRVASRIVDTQVTSVLEDGRATGLCLMISQDVTTRREVEENLAVTSRLAAMGTLISGIAHEINNPLSGSLAGTDWAAKRLKDLQAELERAGSPASREMARGLEEVLDSLEDALAGSRRIAAIVKDLVVTGHPSPDRTRVRIRDVVAEAVLRMPAPLRERCMVRVVDRGAPDVLAAAGQMSQAIANLLDNAAASMPPGAGQDVVVRLGRTDGGAAFVEVEDQGSGIQPEAISRIFDPFFTTRPIGQGIGLGLSVAHAIVTAHGGTLTATSTPGEGSIFRIELPAER